MTRKELIEQAFMWHGTDKLTHGYAMIYEKVPTYIKSIFEIGVGGGHSIRAWIDIFPFADIYALDCGDKKVEHPRVTNIQSEIKNFAPEPVLGDTKVDLIVDDGSHQCDDIIAAWKLLKRYCGGFYVIEDVDFNSSHKIVEALRDGSDVNSVLQTNRDDGSRVIVASPGKVIQW